MPLETTEAVRATFLAATRQSLARNLRTDKDFERFNAISAEAEARTRAEHTAFQQDYEMRMADARQIILREETGLHLDHPKPADMPHVSDKAVLDQKADMRVRLDHQRRLAVIKTDELDQYQELNSFVRARDGRQGQAKEAFNRTQTRSGPTQQR